MFERDKLNGLRGSIVLTIFLSHLKLPFFNRITALWMGMFHIVKLYFKENHNLISDLNTEMDR